MPRPCGPPGASGASPGWRPFWRISKPRCCNWNGSCNRAGTGRGGYRKIEIFDPRHRVVSAAPFHDRVVHHAWCAVCEPVLERGFIHDSHANRVGKGTHRAVAHYERFRDRFRYVLRGDIFRYFPAIDHEILKRDLRRRIGCKRTLALADRIVDGSNRQEPVDLPFPGDDLLTPLQRRRGLPIGNLTSQLFANVYLNPLDHYCKQVLRAKGYLRYVDDFAVFHDDRRQLEQWRNRIETFLHGRRLRLHPRKTEIVATQEPAKFLASSCCRAGAGGCPRTTFGVSETGCAGCATAGGTGRPPGTKSNGACAHGSPMPNTPIPGACASPSFAADGSIRRGSLTRPLARVARRFLEQQPEEPPLREPQQEHHREPERQQRVPRGPHAQGPEPAVPRHPRERDERPGRVMMSGTAPRLLLRAAEAARRHFRAIIERKCPRVRLGMTSVVPYAPSAPMLRNLQGAAAVQGAATRSRTGDDGVGRESPESGYLHSRPGNPDLEGIGKWSVRRWEYWADRRASNRAFVDCGS